MKAEDYERYLQLLGQELQQQGITGEILIVDDVIVPLDVHQPEMRRDIEAYIAGDNSAISFPTTIDGEAPAMPQYAHHAS